MKSLLEKRPSVCHTSISTSLSTCSGNLVGISGQITADFESMPWCWKFGIYTQFTLQFMRQRKMLKEKQCNRINCCETRECNVLHQTGSAGVSSSCQVCQGCLCLAVCLTSFLSQGNWTLRADGSGDSRNRQKLYSNQSFLQTPPIWEGRGHLCLSSW